MSRQSQYSVMSIVLSTRRAPREHVLGDVWSMEGQAAFQEKALPLHMRENQEKGGRPWSDRQYRQ